MHMNTQRFTRHTLSMNTSRICQPVMCMDNIEIVCTCNDTSNNRIIINLFVQISRITSRKIHCTKVVDIHIIKVGIDVLTQLEVKFWRHNITKTILHIIIAKFTISDWHMIHCHNLSVGMVFITKRMWQAEDCLNITLRMQTF